MTGVLHAIMMTGGPFRLPEFIWLRGEFGRRQRCELIGWSGTTTPAPSCRLGASPALEPNGTGSAMERGQCVTLYRTRSVTDRITGQLLTLYKVQN